MGYDWAISIEQPTALLTSVELNLLQEAYQRSPGSAELALQLANRLLINDRFEEVIELLEPRGDLSNTRTMFLIQAYFARKDPAADRKVVELAELGLATAKYPEIQARMLADMGKALIRLNDPDAALAALHRALELNPADRNALKRITAIHLKAGNPELVIALAERLHDRGIGHSRLFASLVLAKAIAGDLPGAQALEGRAELMRNQTIDTPPGWNSLAAFNAELAGQLQNHPALRFDRYGAASTRTWRIDTPAMAEAPLVAVLQQVITRHVASYVADLDAFQHPWIGARPTGGLLHNWCVLTDGDGQEEWHVHQNGWLSGTYYVAVPESVQSATDERGCLVFGVPEDMTDLRTAEQFGQYVLRPEPGLLTLFPSHCYHRTFPHQAETRRICLAFDIWPN